MKMADNTLLMTFQNNCESINSNCVEVPNDLDEKIAAATVTDNDITTTKMETITNSPDNQPDEEENVDAATAPEDAVDKFLAGDGKNEFNDELLLNNMDDNENEGIPFKSDNTIILMGEEEVEEEDDDTELERVEEDEEEDEIEDSTSSAVTMATSKRRCLTVDNYIESNLEKETDECLNKMQIMEDVREGCNVQPSSPGHAEQRTDETIELKTETVTENGYTDDNSNNENSNEKTINNDEPNTDDIKIENLTTAETIKADSQSESNQFIEETYSSPNSPVTDSTSGQSPTKRKQDNDDTPTKRLRTDIQENFETRDKILNDFLEMSDCHTVNQIQIQTEQILSEIRTLNELAKEKEREWNNIIHLKKIKEELLIRMQRKKQLILMGDSDILSDSLNDNNSIDDPIKSNYNCATSILKANLTNSSPKSSLRSKHRTILPKIQSSLETNGGIDFRQQPGRQRPIIDVQSIIADYRQRHPEAVPRRGRRIRHSQSDTNSNNKCSNSILSFSSIALGSGSQMRQCSDAVNSELGILLGSLAGNRQDGSNTPTDLSQPQDTTSFKDMLVQFARLSQSERNELIQNAIKPPPPYPEVTVHPVPTTTAPPTNSLLHGILTKTQTKANKASFSPTLARLLTAPEGSANNNNLSSTTTITSSNNTIIHPANMSISEILSTSKARNEITITPVGTQFDLTTNKSRTAEEEEAEDSVDRLVIDESNEDVRKGGDNNSDAGDEIPQCQGCNQKPAQFVCAGCGNQWYCSRDCQVSAWDEHSEVCSG